MTYFAWQATATESLSPGAISTSFSSLLTPGECVVSFGTLPFSLSFPSASLTCFSEFSEQFSDSEQFSCKVCCFCLSGVGPLTLTRVNCASESQPAKSQHFNLWACDPLFLLWETDEDTVSCASDGNSKEICTKRPMVPRTLTKVARIENDNC